MLISYLSFYFISFNIVFIIFIATSWFKKYGLVAIVIHKEYFQISLNFSFNNPKASWFISFLLIQFKQKSKSISNIKLWFLL